MIKTLNTRSEQKYEPPFTLPFFFRDLQFLLHLKVVQDKRLRRLRVRAPATDGPFEICPVIIQSIEQQPYKEYGGSLAHSHEAQLTFRRSSVYLTFILRLVSGLDLQSQRPLISPHFPSTSDRCSQPMSSSLG